MKVLKHGEKKPRRFTCLNCGCEFVADTSEYWRKQGFGVIYYECDCPECNFTPETSESWEEKDD